MSSNRFPLSRYVTKLTQDDKLVLVEEGIKQLTPEQKAKVQELFAPKVVAGSLGDLLDEDDYEKGGPLREAQARSDAGRSDD